LSSRSPGEPGPPDGEARKPRPAAGDVPAASKKPPAPRPAANDVPAGNRRPTAPARGGSDRPAAGRKPRTARPAAGDVPAANKKPPAPPPSDPAANGDSQESDESEERQAKAPWHFKVIVVGSVIYLGWRLYQGIGWLAHHL
jgi:hypothetical protein